MGDNNGTRIIRQRFGPDAELPAAATAEQGDEYHGLTLGTLRVLGVAAGSPAAQPVREWKLIAGGGGSSGWPNYVVSADADVPAPYATPGAALASAVANGHGPANPAVILIHPGTYAGDPLNLPGGIDLVGFSEDRSQVVISVGANVNVAAVAAPTSIANLTIAGQLLIAAGADVGTTNVLVDPPGAGDAVTVTSALLRAVNCDFRAGGGGVALRSAAPVDVLALRTSLAHTTLLDSDPLLGAAALAGGVHDWRDCEVTGFVALVTATLGLFRGRIASNGTSCVSLLTGAILSVEGFPALLRGGAAGNIIDGAGPGTVNWRDLATGASRGVAATLTTVAGAAARSHTISRLAGAGPHALTTNTATDLVVVDVGAAAVVLNLPDVNTLNQGRTIRFRKVGAGTLTLTAAGGDTIEGSATLVLGGATPAGAELQADPGAAPTPSWVPYSFSQFP